MKESQGRATVGDRSPPLVPRRERVVKRNHKMWRHEQKASTASSSTSEVIAMLDSTSPTHTNKWLQNHQVREYTYLT